MMERALRSLTRLGFEREEIVELPKAFARGAVTPEGEHIAVCGTQARVCIPAMGAVTLMPSSDGEVAPTVTAYKTAGGFVMRSERVELCWMSRRISFLISWMGAKTAGRPMNVLRMYKDGAAHFRCVGYRQQLPRAAERDRRSRGYPNRMHGRLFCKHRMVGANWTFRCPPEHHADCRQSGRDV